MSEEFVHDIALLKLRAPIPNHLRILPICASHLPPFDASPQLLGACGRGSTSRTHYIPANVLQETFFYESMFESNTKPHELRLCRDDNVCVESVAEGANMCLFDDGSPLYVFECGTLNPKCLYGVSSFSRGRVDTPGELCNNGSFFAKVPRFYHWMSSIIEAN